MTGSRARRLGAAVAALVALLIALVAVYGFIWAGPGPKLRLSRYVASRGDSVAATVSWNGGGVRLVMLVWDGPVGGTAVREVESVVRYVFERELVRLPAGEYVVQGFAGASERDLYPTSQQSLTVIGLP